MPRQTSPALVNHMKGDSLTVCMLWKASLLNGTVYSFTDLDRDIVYDDGTGLRTYVSSTGFLPSALENSGDMAVDNMDLLGLLAPEAVSEIDIAAGLWDQAKVVVYRVNYNDLSMGHEFLNKGTLGNITVGRLTFNSEIRGLTQPLQQHSSRTIQPLCTAIFGDSRCKKNAADFTSTGAVVGVIDTHSFISDLASPVDYYANGQVKWLTGANAGLTQSIKYFAGTPTSTTRTQTSVISAEKITLTIPAGSTYARDYGVIDSDGLAYTLTNSPTSTHTYQPTAAGVYFFNSADNGRTVTITFTTIAFTPTSSGQVDLQLAMPFEIQPGDTFTAVAGCDHLQKTCNSKYSNIVNFQGFPFLPGVDRLVTSQS